MGEGPGGAGRRGSDRRGAARGPVVARAGGAVGVSGCVMVVRHIRSFW